MAANGNNGWEKETAGTFRALTNSYPDRRFEDVCPQHPSPHAPVFFSPRARCFRRLRSRQRRAELSRSRSAGSWEPNPGTERDVLVSGGRLGQQKAGTWVSAPLGKRSLPAGRAAGPAEKWVRPRGFDVSGWFLRESGGSRAFTLRRGWWRHLKGNLADTSVEWGWGVFSCCRGIRRSILLLVPSVRDGFTALGV